MIATDTSAQALAVARANAERLDLADRVEFVEAMLPPDICGRLRPAHILGDEIAQRATLDIDG